MNENLIMTPIPELVCHTATAIGQHDPGDGPLGPF